MVGACGGGGGGQELAEVLLMPPGMCTNRSRIQDGAKEAMEEMENPRDDGSPGSGGAIPDAFQNIEEAANAVIENRG